MKKKLLPISVLLTTTAVVMSIYLSTLEDPTDIQDRLSSTTNTIAVAGTTTIFGLLNDDEQDDSGSA